MGEYTNRLRRTQWWRKRGGWERQVAFDGSSFVGTDEWNRGMAVILSIATEQDGKRWIHVSASWKDRIPTYEELRRVKDEFIGVDRKAMQIFAPASEHVNIHPHCLHLWHCIDGDSLPDFTRGGGSI